MLTDDLLEGIDIAVTGATNELVIVGSRHARTLFSGRAHTRAVLCDDGESRRAKAGQMDAVRKAISKVMRPNPRRCEEARSLMSDYVDGELDPVERKRLERHVRFCDRCYTVLNNLRQTLGRLRGLQGSDPPGGGEPEALAERIGHAWRGQA